MENPNGDGYNFKELATIRPEYYTEKELTKGPKCFGEKSGILGHGNTGKDVFDVSGAVFYSTFDKF